MAGIYQGFDVYIRDITGEYLPQSGATVLRYNETTSTALSSVTTNLAGGVDNATLGASNSVGDVIRFSVSPYTPVIRRTLSSTLSEAIFEKDLNLVLADAYSPTPQDAQFVEVYFSESNTDFKNARRIGIARRGDVLTMPYASDLDKTVYFYQIPIDEKGAPRELDIAAAVNTSFAFAEQEIVSATGNIAKRTTIVNSASGTTQTLPTAVGKKGKRYTVKNIGAGTVTLEGAGAETIFTMSAVLNTPIETGDSITVESNGVNFFVV